MHILKGRAHTFFLATGRHFQRTIMERAAVPPVTLDNSITSRPDRRRVDA
jgi:hypothetical protein